MNQRELEIRSPERTGQMTQVMRAASREAAPTVLRIAMVQRGVVVDERVVARDATVTVGPTERATFVVASSRLAPSHPLFEHKGGAYCLNLLEGMTGRVATRAGLVELGARVPRLTLGADARGKVVVGDATFLFQFVAERPPRTNVPLPLSARASLTSEIDWTTTIVAAMSFLLHFGVIASLYGDWLDPTVDDSVVVGRVIETVRALPAPPAVERHDAPVESAPTMTAAAETTRAPSRGGTRGPGHASEPKASSSGPGKMTDKQAIAIVAGLKTFDMEMIGALTTRGSSTERVLKEGAPTDLMNDVAKDGAGVNRGGIAGLDTKSSNGGPVRPGARTQGISDIGSTQGTAPTSAGSTVAAPRPKGNAQVAPPESRGGEVPGAGGVVAALTGGFRRCYNTGLAQEDPTMHGSMRVVAHIAPNGDVSSVSPTPGGGNLSGTVMGCVAQKVAGARFAAPTGGGGATLVIPVSFLLP